MNTLRKREQCAALDQNLDRCRRRANGWVAYHGDFTIYGLCYGTKPTTVRVALCEQHADERKPKAKGAR